MQLLLSLLLAQLSSTAIYMNQVAFEADGPKTAIVEGTSSLAGTTFSLKRGNVVAATGMLSPATQLSDWKSGVYYYQARFDTVKTAGTYTLTAGGGVSGSFAIGKDSLVGMGLAKVLGFFNADRWTGPDNVTKYDGGSTTYDMQGGWKDATGDVSKYLSHLSYANYMNPQQIPMSTWILAFAADRVPALLQAKGLYTGMRAEALWGADYLVRSLDPEGYFYITVFDGWDVKNTRQICAFTTKDGIRTSDYQAAWREGAGMSIAALARVSSWGADGSKTSAQYLAAAKAGYAHLVSKPAGIYADDKKENILDDYCALLAATELYAATDSAPYLADARTRAALLALRVSDDGYFWSDDAKTRPFYHAVDAGLPLVALTRYLEIDTLQDALVKKAVVRHLNYLTSVTAKVANPFGYARQTFRYNSTIKEGFFIPHVNESGYWWQGENARLGSLASAAFYAGRFIGYRADSAFGLPDSLLRYGMSQIDWILGKNPKDYSFMAGVGRKQAPGYYVTSNGEHPGGIVNGITGSNDKEDGTGIDYKVATDFPMNANYTVGPWMSWRWTEQWIPHAHWFLMAMATLRDEVRTGVKATPPPLSIASRSRNALHASFVRTADRLEIHLASPSARDAQFQVSDVRGRILARATVRAGAYAATAVLPATREVLAVSGPEGSALVRP